jgi:hypothetical protein
MYVDQRDVLWKRVLQVRPGITDPVTLKLRDEEALLAAAPGDPERFYREQLQPAKLREYVAYLDARTVGTDVRVLVETVRKVFFPGRPPLPASGAAVSESRDPAPSGPPDVGEALAPNGAARRS